MRLTLRSAAICFALSALPLAAADDPASWQRQAAHVQITRDDWGIAHIHGKTDADAVFGMIYAQAEDDFNRVETNYLVALGRLAEAEGPSAVAQDLRTRLFIDPTDLQARYAKAPAWLKALAVSWADALNFYLATHPEVKPRALTHFEPWMTLAFSEGSIGGDIERINLAGVAKLYVPDVQVASANPRDFVEPSGSNGIAIAPANTAAGHALLLINPHTSFYFRAEQQVTSDAGLNAYGAATWGQFFVYQGFNAHAGWMHTTSSVDSIDEFAETLALTGTTPSGYMHGGKLQPIITRQITLNVRQSDGSLKPRSFTTWATLHGPIVRREGDRWISASLMHMPVEALSQSFLRTKAQNYAEFARVMQLGANSTNNTVFADSQGTIAFLPPQFIPRRADSVDRTKPVDGSNAALDWQGLLPLSETPAIINPATGWVANSNNGPWSAAGSASPVRANFPRYIDSVGENPRGVHSTRLFDGVRGWSLNGLVTAAYDPALPAFDRMLPPLFAAYDALPAGDAQRARLSDPIAALRGWDRRWATTSVPTSLAVFWGEEMWKLAAASDEDDGLSVYDGMVSRTTPAQKLGALDAAVARLTNDFGKWATPWGEINRFQRLDGAIAPHFDDSKPSLPVGFTSGQWGSLASFGARAWPGTKRYYGTSGNSFVAVVEFGPRVKARAVTAGGQSGHPGSPHFDDQALRYTTGDLRAVYYYPDELAGHVARRYRPGE